MPTDFWFRDGTNDLMVGPDIYFDLGCSRMLKHGKQLATDQRIESCFRKRRKSSIHQRFRFRFNGIIPDQLSVQVLQQHRPTRLGDSEHFVDRGLFI